MQRALRASMLALLCLSLAPAASADGPFRLVVGYTQSAIQEVYLEDGKTVAKTMVGRYLETMDPELQADLVAFESRLEMDEALKSKRVDMVGGASHQIVAMVRQRGLKPVMVAQTASGVYDDAVLLVKKDSGFSKLTDLKARRLMILEGAAPGHHHLWLDTWILRETNETVGSFFKSVTEGRTSSQVILACFFSRVDACLVPRGALDLAQELNPQTGERLRVLGSSTGLVGAIVAFRPGYDPALMTRATHLMERLHDRPGGQQILRLFRRNRLVAFKPEYAAGIEALVSEHAQRLGGYRDGVKAR